LNARRENRCLSVFTLPLQTVARGVDDVRALTWSPDLSDALGRMQIQIRRLANELEVGALGESGATIKPRVQATVCAEAGDSLNELSDENNWPYLAI
jgi:predicted secreted protein